MGNKGRWDYLRAIYERYQKAGRKAKKVILNEFCANTGYNRKYAIRLLNGPLPCLLNFPSRCGRPPLERSLGIIPINWTLLSHR